MRKIGQYAFKTRHVFWDQVQGYMFLGKRKYLDEMSPRKPNIGTLTDFYFHKRFPNIVEGER